MKAIKLNSELFLYAKISLLLSSLCASVLLFSPLSVNAVHLFHTASTFAKDAENPRVGIEVEFAGLSLQETLKIVHDISGGKIIKKEKKIKTTLKEVTEKGLVYNEATIPEWVIENSLIGELIIKVDNNQITDDGIITPENAVIELVTAPIRKAQLPKLQEIITALKYQGAKGTAAGEAVSIQYNIEINEGNIANYNWQELIDLMRVYMNPIHREQIDAHLNVLEIRKNYVQLYSPGFFEKLIDPQYKPTARELFDDFFYRQSLELLGFKDAWDIEISHAQKLLLAQRNPIVPLVVKQNKLRISSLLGMAFPNDPITKIYVQSGWMTPMPIIEWREFNNDFKVIEHYREVAGLMYMTKKFKSFNHDILMSQLSGVEEPMIKELRTRYFNQINKSSGPIIFRYFIGNPKTVNRSEYADLAKGYAPHPVTFLPFYEYGKYPLSIPGESVVMHRNQFHRNDVIGKYNPGLINGFIMQALENKYVEMKFWDEYVKKGIPKTLLISELGVQPLKLDSSKIILDQVKEIVKTFNLNFKKGWVLKGLFDLGTEKEILSDKSDLVALVETYLSSDFESYKKEIDEKYNNLQTAPEYALTKLKEHKGYKGWKALQLLRNDKSVIIQERFNIISEFRVEIVAGRVLGGRSTVDRYAYMYLKNGKFDSSYKAPDKKDLKAAEAYAKEVASSLPPELQNMTFGLDIAIIEGGEAVMIESNPGGNSNFLYEEEISNVKKLTQFLLKFPELIKTGKIHIGWTPKEQMEFLKRKFSDWRIETESLYPGMKFLEDKIVDSEFKKNNSVKLEKKTPILKLSKPKVFKCEAIFLN